MEEIRSWWELPSIAHFCSLFRAAFGLTDFEIEDLEDALIIDGSSEEEGSRFLADLHARLLRGLFLTKDIDADNFEPFLSQVLKIRWEDELGKKNPLADNKYRNLSTREKVEILHSLCDFRLDVDDVADLLKGLEADSLRVEPLGYDANGNTFWYFYGTRLYKERNQDSVAKEKLEKKKAKKKKKLLLKKKKQKGKLKKKKKKEGSSSDESFSGSDSSSDDSDSLDDSKSSNSPDSEAEPLPEWSLVCSTVKEWEELTESFRGSKNRDERALYDTLSMDFVSEIAQMIEVKEKALQRKLMMEMNPRRTSERIALKASVREEEEKSEESERQREKERQAEIKKKEDEEKQKEKQRLMEKRQRERAERARAREERQWLIANGEELPAEFAANLRKHEDTDENSQEVDTAKLKQRASAEGEDRDEDLYTGMYKLLDSLKKHSQAWPFLEPVDESYAPQYHEIIEHPMDLSTIEQKLDDSKYFSLDEFSADMKLMFENCHEYNGPDSMYTKMANALEAAFNRQLKKHFPDDEDNSDEDFEEELMKKSKKKTKELPKPKKPAHFVDNFMRDSVGMDQVSPNPPKLHNMAQAMPSMQPFYPNHLPPMNHMTGRGMMPPGHPTRFPYHPTAHFSPDGHPLYPPQFYQNFNRGMSPYGMPPHPQYNQFAHMASQMARPQTMQGYPNSMMQGHVRFPPNARENSIEGYKKAESEQPESPQLSIPAVSTSGEVTPSSETSDHHEPDSSAKSDSHDQRLSEAATIPGPHVRHKPFEQGPPETRPVPPTARPMDFGQQLPMRFGSRHMGPQGYFNPRSQVPMQMKSRPEGYMQRMPVSAGSGMPFSGVAGSYQQNHPRLQMPELKHIHGQNLPPKHDQQVHDQKIPRPKSSPSSINERHQTSVSAKTAMDQNRVKSAISPTQKHESEEDEVPFPFIIRPGQNKKSESEGGTVHKDDAERTRDKHPVSSSSENEHSETEKQSSRKPLGFPISQLLNDPAEARSENVPHETITRPGGQPSVIKSTAAVTPSPTTHHSLPPEDRVPSSEQSSINRSLTSRGYAHVDHTQKPSTDGSASNRVYPSMKSLQNQLDRLTDRSDQSSRVDPKIDPSSRNPVSERLDPNRGYPSLETSRNSITNRSESVRGYSSVEHSLNPAVYKDWPSPAIGGETPRPRSFLEELNGDDFSSPRSYPEFSSHSGRSGVDLQNHHLPFTSLLKEMAPPGSTYNKPQELDRTDPRYGKNYTDRDSLRESQLPGRSQLQSLQNDSRHADRQRASFENSLYGNEKRVPHVMPSLFRPSNGASQDLNSTSHSKEFGETTGSNATAASSERQLIDLDNVPYRRAMYQSTEGAYNRDALFMASQRGQQPQAQVTAANIPPTMSQIFPGPPGGQGGPPMMSYSAMLRQQQLFEAAYASHMVRNGEYPLSRVEDGVPAKVPRFS